MAWRLPSDFRKRLWFCPAATWVTPDETVFLGQIGPVTLLIIRDEEDHVTKSLGLVFEAMTEQPP